MDISQILQKLPVHIYDETDRIASQLYQPFAWGDAFLREVNRDNSKMILHIWPMENTLILGMLDRRLPYCDEAIKEVRTHGYRAVVRNVGGLAVVADAGILNFSFIIPKLAVDKFSIQDAYLFMTNFVKEVFAQYGKQMDHFTIEDSYCPGDFDMSINGKKFAGIAQRRFKEGVSISIYLSVCGNQAYRGQLVKQFYEKGLGGEETTFKFTTINPDVMQNLSDLLGVPLNVEIVRQLLIETLDRFYATHMPLEVTPELKEEYTQLYDKMIERNRKV